MRSNCPTKTHREIPARREAPLSPRSFGSLFYHLAIVPIPAHNPYTSPRLHRVLSEYPRTEPAMCSTLPSFLPLQRLFHRRRPAPLVQKLNSPCDAVLEGLFLPPDLAQGAIIRVYGSIWPFHTIHWPS